MKKVLIIVPLFCLMFMLTGCEETESQSKKHNRIDKAVNACIEQGGVPIFSDSWADEMEDCKFKNNE